MIPVETIVKYGQIREDRKEAPECQICLETEKKVHCIGQDQIVAHRALPSERNLGNRVYHYFHKSCLGQWLATLHSEKKCPGCRIILSDESIERELEPSSMEKWVEAGEKVLGRAARGMFYGAWSWVASRTLTGGALNLSDLFRIIGGGMLTAVVTPVFAKLLGEGRGDLLPLSMSFFTLSCSVLRYLLPPEREKIADAPEVFLTMTFLMTFLVARADTMGVVVPEWAVLAQDLERRIDELSWKAIPALVLGVAYRVWHSTF